MTSDYLVQNRDFWNAYASDWVARGEAAWRSKTAYWGIWETPEAELGLLPEALNGAVAVELGCGTGYVSRWLELRGAEVVAIDVSQAQLATAQRLAQSFSSSIQFVRGNAETVMLPDQFADLVISEYGAALWCDPYRWLPKAARILKRGGQLVMYTNHPLSVVCLTADGEQVSERLSRSYFELHKQDWTQLANDPGGVEFNLSLSNWLALFKANDLRLESLHEIRAPDQKVHAQFGVPWGWARDYPSELAFVLNRC